MDIHPITKELIDTDRVEVFVKKENSFLKPIVVNAIEIEMLRGGSCSSCKFEVYQEPGEDPEAQIDMGDAIRIRLDKENFWYGYVFKSEEDKEGLISYVAYDQLRYLGFKDTYQYENLTYSDLLKRICTDRNLLVGEIESSEYKIPMRIEEDKEYWEMLQVASDETTAYEGNIYILYDQAGKICLKNIKNMKVDDFLLNERTGENYKYEISIDDNTFNRVKVDVVSEDSDEVVPVILEDKNTISKWGVLQWYAQTTEPIDQVKGKAKQLLEVLNRPTKTIKFENVFGHKDIRGGSLVPVKIKLRNAEIDGFMMVESVTHKLEMGVHTMDLVLYNKDFLPMVNTDNVFLYEKKQAEAELGIEGADWMSGGTIQEQIWSFFKSKGYSNAAIAGIMGNMAQESNFNPTAIGDGGTSYGLAQWHAGRWENLKAYANSVGKPMGDVKTQLEFFHKELMAMPGGKDYMKMTSPESASDWITTHYERPDESLASRPNRRAQAVKFANQFKNWTPFTATSSASGTTGKRAAFLNEVLKREGKAYSQEARMTDWADDCSSLILKAMRKVGLDTTGANMTTHVYATDPRVYEIPWNQRQPGDILYRDGHVEVFMGGNQTFGAFDYGVKTGYGSNINRFNKVYRIKGL